jgi:small subunit ribosomal protein S17
MAEPKDSGTESAETSVNEEAAVEETPTEALSEETPVAEATTETVAEDAAPAAAAAPAVSEPKKKRKRLPRSQRHTHSKPKREQGATRKPISREAKPETSPAARQERRGIVVSDKGEKTIIVKVAVTKLHPKYKKVVRRSRKFHAHDEQNAAGVGDIVRIVESRPLSKLKNWRLAEIVEKAK